MLRNKENAALLGGVGVQINYMAGTIANNEIHLLSKLIFRASRGQVLSTFDT